MTSFSGRPIGDLVQSGRVIDCNWFTLSLVILCWLVQDTSLGRKDKRTSQFPGNYFSGY